MTGGKPKSHSKIAIVRGMWKSEFITFITVAVCPNERAVRARLDSAMLECVPCLCVCPCALVWAMVRVGLGGVLEAAASLLYRCETYEEKRHFRWCRICASGPYTKPPAGFVNYLKAARRKRKPARAYEAHSLRTKFGGTPLSVK